MGLLFIALLFQNWPTKKPQGPRGKTKKHASGGEVSHLESLLPLGIALRSSGQRPKAFAACCARLQH